MLYRIRRDRVVVCLKHVVELRALDGPLEVVDEEDAGGCVLCESDVDRAGRVCEREACRKPLHPRWPAVYCSNACAFADASVPPPRSG